MTGGLKTPRRQKGTWFVSSQKNAIMCGIWNGAETPHGKSPRDEDATDLIYRRAEANSDAGSTSQYPYCLSYVSSDCARFGLPLINSRIRMVLCCIKS